jgi:hypothetical protein
MILKRMIKINSLTKTINIHMQNYHQLRAIRDNFNDITNNQPGLLYALSGKMNSFYTANKENLKAMNEKLIRLAQKHVQKDEGGKPMLDEEGKWIFPSEEAKQAYTDEYNTFFNKSITIK